MIFNQSECEIKSKCTLVKKLQSSVFMYSTPEKTHLLCKGKYHCTADLLFDWFGFSCFVQLKL